MKQASKNIVTQRCPSLSFLYRLGPFTVPEAGISDSLDGNNTMFQGLKSYVAKCFSRKQLKSTHSVGSCSTIISTDGHSLPGKGQMKDTLPVNAGERFDFVFKADNPGTWAFHCHDLHHVTNDGVYPGGLLTVVEYE